jgi:hypothetical protein
MAPTARAMASASHHALFLVAVACASVGEGLGLEGVDASGECDHAAQLVARSFKCTNSLTRSHHGRRRVVAWGDCAPTAATVATVAIDTANRRLYRTQHVPTILLLIQCCFRAYALLSMIYSLATMQRVVWNVRA